jgi:probable rRNA maturation factor
VARPDRVRLLNRQRKLKPDTAALRRLAERVLDAEGADPGVAVEIVLVRDATIGVLNAEYLGRPVATDVLAFPVDREAWPAGEMPLLGSVVVSVDTAASQATERGLPVRQELRRLVAHGVLHLLGWRDGTPRERARMRRREDRYVASRPRGR